MKSRRNGLRLGVVGTVMNLDLYDAMCDANLTIQQAAERFEMTEDAFTALLFMQYIPMELNESLCVFLVKATGKSIEQVFPSELRGRSDLQDLLEETYLSSDSGNEDPVEVMNPHQVSFEVQMALRARFGSVIRELISNHLDIDEQVIVTEMWLNECSAEDVAESLEVSVAYVKQVSNRALEKLSKLPTARRLRRVHANMN